MEQNAAALKGSGFLGGFIYDGVPNSVLLALAESPRVIDHGLVV